MTPVAAIHLKRAIIASARAEDWATVRALATLVDASSQPEEVARCAISNGASRADREANAQRVAEFFATNPGASNKAAARALGLPRTTLRRLRSVAVRGANSKVATVTMAEPDTVAAASPLSHSPLSAKTLSQDSSPISSSSQASPEQGSNLEERDRSVAADSPAPTSFPLTDELVDACRMAGAPAPTVTDIALALRTARSKGLRRADWFSYLVGWQCRQKTFQPARRTAIVQPGDPRVEWMQEGHGEFEYEEEAPAPAPPPPAPPPPVAVALPARVIQHAQRRAVGA